MASAGPALGQISCSMASTLVRLVRARAGDEGVRDVLGRSGVEHTATYLDDPGNWIWLHEAVELLKAAAVVLDDPEIGLHVGEETVRQHAGTPVATMLRSLGSPEAVHEQLTVGSSKFSTVTELIPEVEPGRAVVHTRARHGFARDQIMCDWTRGLLSQPPALFGAPPAHVEESTCAARGDAECCYTATWDAELATADPQALVTALETQLAAMTARLRSCSPPARPRPDRGRRPRRRARPNHRARGHRGARPELPARGAHERGRPAARPPSRLPGRGRRRPCASAARRRRGGRGRARRAHRRGCRAGTPPLRPADGGLARRRVLPARARHARRVRAL